MTLIELVSKAGGIELFFAKISNTSVEYNDLVGCIGNIGIKLDQKTDFQFRLLKFQANLREFAYYPLLNRYQYAVGFFSAISNAISNPLDIFPDENKQTNQKYKIS